MDEPSRQDREKDYANSFQAEFDFVVIGNLVASVVLVFNETFENENQVVFEWEKDFNILQLDEGRFLSPSFLKFCSDGSICFSMLFVAASVQEGSNQSQFLELLWRIAHLGLRAKLEESMCKEFAAELNVAMDELASISSSSELDPLKYYGLFF